MAWHLLTALLVTALAGDARFDDAVARFKGLDYEGSLRELDALLAEPRPDAERETLLLYTGAARALLGDEAAARLAFEGALRIDDHAELGINTSPKVIALFDEVKRAVVASQAKPPPPPVPPPPSTDAPPIAPRAPPHAPPAEMARVGPAAGPTAAEVVGVASSVAALAALASGAAFGVDVASKMQLANDKSTSQVRAQQLVDDANASLAFAGVLAGAGVVAAGAAVTAFLWPDDDAEHEEGVSRASATP